ncbi:unnamed protein product [Oikopleura dioica]|uniref:Uncharacterized protein n=1 Tax=Oikopleura dioica TaxID=34765 RepID=E4Y5V5_OIKDI|nr:unnamed protein product [Oikopleura dioica]
MEKMFLDHVLVLWSANQRDAWREKAEDYLRNRLEKMLVLKFTDKLGKQDGGNWVFSNKAQFYSNGAQIPEDMLQFYHSTSPASENFPKISEEDQLRSFLLSLRKAHNGSLAPALLFSAHVLKFHESVYEVLRLSNGANVIPKFVSSKKAGVICKTFAKVTSVKDGVNVCSADGDVADFMNSSDVEMSDNILIDIPFFEIIDGSLNSKEFVKTWIKSPTTKYSLLPQLIKLEKALSADSFDERCRGWSDLISKESKDRELKLHIAFLFATLELLGDVHGDWDRHKVQELASQILGEDFKSPLKRPNNGSLSTVSSKLPRIESVPTVQSTLAHSISNFPATSLASSITSSLLKTTTVPATVSFQNEHENLPPIDGLGGLIFSSRLDPKLSSLSPPAPNAPLNTGLSSFSSNPDMEPAKEEIEALIQNPLTTENMHKIVNAIIAFFLGQIPPNRDPKDFIRSSYRTRDSTEVYLALRLPILRRLLDAETRKVFRDILDSCGGQRQQTRFGSDSTSAQLIPRDLVSKTNLDRIEIMIRNRAEQRKMLQTSRPLGMSSMVHSGLSLLPENLQMLSDAACPQKQFKLGDILTDENSLSFDSEECTVKIEGVE